MIASACGRMPYRWYAYNNKAIRWVSQQSGRPNNRSAIEQRPRRIRSDKR